jgi:hypothetical protein
MIQHLKIAEEHRESMLQKHPGAEKNERRHIVFLKDVEGNS